jgi:hypothetical protein
MRAPRRRPSQDATFASSSCILSAVGACAATALRTSPCISPSLTTFGPCLSRASKFHRTLRPSFEPPTHACPAFDLTTITSLLSFDLTLRHYTEPYSKLYNDLGPAVAVKSFTIVHRIPSLSTKQRLFCAHNPHVAYQHRLLALYLLHVPYIDTALNEFSL